METDAAIVRRAIEGDERAMRLLWNQHSPHVDAVVRRLAGDPDLAEDIAQEVWIQIFRALPSWRGDAKFSTWVHRVAINRALNALRRVKRVAAAETGIEEDSAFVIGRRCHICVFSFLRILLFFLLAAILVLILRLFYLQIIQGSYHKSLSEQNKKGASGANPILRIVEPICRGTVQGAQISRGLKPAAK